MNGELDERTKIAAFYISEYTGCGDSEAVWHCAEDIACFFERCGILTVESLYNVLLLNKNSREYRGFIRQLAYRLHTHTGTHGSDDGAANWYAAEKLIENHEWRNAVLHMCNYYARLAAGGTGAYAGEIIRSGKVREYYDL